jgi:hypothetical protein
MGVGFFGLAKNHSALLHTQIFEMVEYSNGFTIMELYKMPTYLRTFYYNKLIESKKRESEEAKKTNQSANASKVRFKR